MTESNNDRRVRYTVTNPSGQTEFDIDFPLDDVDYIRVYVDGVLKAYTTHYTASLTTLKVTFGSAVAQNSIVTLEGHRALERTTDYPLRGSLRSRVLNDDLDAFTQSLQELRRDIDRTVSLNKAEGDGSSAVMPLFEASKVLRVNAGGTALEMVDAADLNADLAAAVTAAEAAQTAAELAETNAETAEVNAETAETNAEAARDAALAAVGAVKISGNDTTPGILNGKLVAGTGITLTENNDGGDETLTISSEAAGRLIDVQVFTASGTWTKPAGTNAVEVWVVGAGGGGGGESGGGGPGGTSSFGAHATATGGAGGAIATGNGAIGGEGGVGSSGTSNHKGGAGGKAGAAASNLPGGGGSSMFGGGAIAPGTTGAGNTGGNYGGGASGCFNSSSPSHAAGGGGGGTAYKYITAALGATETVTIGAGGTAGPGTQAGGVGAGGIVIVKSYS